MSSPQVVARGPLPRERRFFSTVSAREWTWIKHSILGSYMLPWSRKVGSSSKTIWVVDCFAGAGGYVDASTGERRDGSPVIAAMEARRYEAARRGHQMRVICVERNPDNFRDLEARLAGFGELVTCLPGDFADHVEQICAFVGNDPALVMLDPIGLKAIGAEACRGLLERVGKTDLFVIVDFSIVHRTRGMLDDHGMPMPGRRSAPALAANIDEFYAGTREWRRVPVCLTVEEREREYLRLYFENVLLNSFTYVGGLPVRKAVGATPEYWMVHAASHIDAHLLMNDEIARVDEELYRRTYADAFPEIVDGMYGERRQQRLDALKSDLLVSIRRAGPRGISFKRLVDIVADRHYGYAKIGKWAGDYGRILRELIAEGEIRRERTPARAKFSPGEHVFAIPKERHASGADAVAAYEKERETE